MDNLLFPTQDQANVIFDHFNDKSYYNKEIKLIDDYMLMYYEEKVSNQGNAYRQFAFKNRDTRQYIFAQAFIRDLEI